MRVEGVRKLLLCYNGARRVVGLDGTALGRDGRNTCMSNGKLQHNGHNRLMMQEDRSVEREMQQIGGLEREGCFYFVPREPKYLVVLTIQARESTKRATGSQRARLADLDKGFVLVNGSNIVDDECCTFVEGFAELLMNGIIDCTVRIEKEHNRDIGFCFENFCFIVICNRYGGDDVTEVSDIWNREIGSSIPTRYHGG